MTFWKPPLSPLSAGDGSSVGVLSHIYPSLEPKNAENPPEFRPQKSPSPSTWGKQSSDWSAGPDAGLWLADVTSPAPGGGDIVTWDTGGRSINIHFQNLSVCWLYLWIYLLNIITKILHFVIKTQSCKNINYQLIIGEMK